MRSATVDAGRRDAVARDLSKDAVPTAQGARVWSQSTVRALLMREGATRLGLPSPVCLAGAKRSVGGPLLRRLVDLLRSEENDRLAIDRSGRGDRQVQ